MQGLQINKNFKCLQIYLYCIVSKSSNDFASSSSLPIHIS